MTKKDGVPIVMQTVVELLTKFDHRFGFTSCHQSHWMEEFVRRSGVTVMHTVVDRDI
jgi:hypothetical protein